MVMKAKWIRIRGGQDKLAGKPDCANIPVETKYQDLRGDPDAGPAQAAKFR